LATIVNTVQNNIVTTGGEAATRQVEGLGRAQTRMGQASASAGRSFAAQSAGLGGLVGAYAGAAATVFALTAAFDALAKAAQAETIVKGTSALAAEIGQSGPKILKSIQDITQGQLTLEEASNAANLALSSGFNTKQIEQLAKVSLGASRALGRNLTDAMTRVVRGAAKMEPELLDELGIFTRIEPAVAAYAAKMNIAATSMTEFERRQAFANAVIEEGTRKFSGIDTTSGSAQKSLEQLSVKVIELGTQFGQLINTYLKPVVDFFKNDFGNTLLLFLGVLTLVFGKAGTILGGFVNQGITKLATLSTAMADFAGRAGNLNLAPVENSTRAARDEAFPVNPGSGRRGSFNPNIAGRSVEQTEALTEALERQRNGTLRTASAITANNRVLQENANITGLSAQRFTYLNTMINANAASLASANRASLLFIGTSRVLQLAVAGLSTAFSYLMMVVNGLFAVIAIAQLVGTLFDVDILGGILDYFKNISESTERMREGFLGLAESVGQTSLAEQFERIGASADQIEEIPDRIEAIRKSLKSLNNATAAETDTDNARARIMRTAGFVQDDLRMTVDGTGIVGTGKGTTRSSRNMLKADKMGEDSQFVASIDGSEGVASRDPAKLIAYRDILGEINDKIEARNQFIIAANASDSKVTDEMLQQHSIVDELLTLQEFLGVAGVTNAQKQRAIKENILDLDTKIADAEGDKLSELRQEKILQESVLKILEQQLEKVTSLISGAAKSTGVATTKVADSLGKKTTVDNNGFATVELFGEKLKEIGKEGIIDYAEQDKNIQELVDGFVLADTTLTDLNKAFNEGTTSSGSLSKGIFGISSELDDLAKAGKRGTQDFKDLQERLNNLVDINEELKRTEKVTKAIRGAFGGEMKAMDNAVQEGSLSLTKEVAKTELDRVKNQRALLLLAISRGKALEEEKAMFLSLSGTEMQLNEQQQAVEVQAQAARKAAQGTALQLVETNAKELLQHQKKNQQLKDNLVKMEQAHNITMMQLDLEAQKLRLKERELSLQSSINNLKEEVKGDQLTIANGKRIIESQKKITSELEKQRVLRQDLITISKDSEASTLASSNKRQNTAANEEISKADANKFVTGKMLLEMQKRQADIEYNQQVTLIASRKQIARDEATAALLANTAKIGIILAENRAKRAEIAALNILNKKQLELFDLEKGLEIQKLRDQLTLLAGQQKIADAQEKAKAADIGRQLGFMNFEQDLIKQQVALRQQDIIFVNQFSAAINAMGKHVDAYVKATPGATGSTTGATLDTTLTTDLSKINKLAQENFDLSKKALTTQLSNLDKVSVAQFNNNQAQQKALNTQISDTEALNELQRTNLVATQQQKIDALNEEIALNTEKLNTIDLEDEKIVAVMKAKIEALEQERLGIVQLKQLEDDRRKVAATERKIDRTFVDAEIKLMQVNLQNAQTLLDISQKQLQIQKQRRDFALSEKLANQGLEDEIRGALGMSDELSKLKSFMATKDDKLGAAGADRADAITGANNTAAVAKQALALQQKQFEVDKFYRQRQLALDIAQLQQLQKIAQPGMTPTERNAGIVEGVNDDQSIARLRQLNSDIENAYMAGFGYQKTAIERQQQLETEAANQKFAKTERDLAREQALLELYASTRYQLYKRLNESINSGISELITKVFDNIRDGKSLKDGLGDVFAGIFENIRNDVLQQTLIKPLQSGATDMLAGAFGLSMDKGIDSVVLKDGKVPVTMGGGEEDPITKVKEDIKTKGMGFFEGFKQKSMEVFTSMRTSLGNFGTNAMETFKGLGSGLKDLFTGENGILSGLGGMFKGLMGSEGGGGLFSSITGMLGMGAGGGGFNFGSLFGMAAGAPMATGGLVGVRSMAAGGQVNALRDRVPTMLEPGEFVMRKPAVKSIGAGNLGKMNATGAGGIGNVQFNIVNQGEPKEAEEQGQPKFEADKIVIDVVMKDLASNGPIRQAMRNG